MSTGVLDHFRRRFVGATIQKRVAGSPLEDDALAVLRTESIQLNDSVLLFRSNRELLKAAARRAGRGSVVFNVDNDPTRVAELREQIATTADLECEATIRCVCAEWSDLHSNLEWAQLKLEQEPVRSVSELLHFRESAASQARENPAIPDGCINVAILPTLNTVPADQLVQLLKEVLRALENRGRVRLACLVSDEPLSAELRRSIPNHYHVPTEMQLMSWLEQAGFYGVELMGWDELPQQVIQSVEIRRLELQAFKGKAGPCYECHQAVVYRGPWKRVHDDDGHVYKRGERTAVCEKTYRILTSEPYRNHFVALPPYIPVPVENSLPFNCNGSSIRDPRITKGLQSTPSQQLVNECSADCEC